MQPQDVAAFCHRIYCPGMTAVKLAPQPVDVDVEPVRLDHPVVVADHFAEPLTGENTSGMAHELVQEPKLARRQVDAAFPQINRLFSEVNPEIAKLDFCGHGHALSHAVA